MRMSGKAFRDWPNKSITLLGMSGVGKTTLASKLPTNRWFHYSGDYRIGTKYLAEPILDNIKRRAMQIDFLRDLLRSDSIYIASNITVDNLEPVSTFLGKLGRQDLGGLALDEFRRRQELHRQAEVYAMRDVAEFIHKAQDIYGYDHFVNDAGGSICELDDEEAIKTLADNSVIIYLRSDPELDELLIQRAQENPKPMYYPDAFLKPHLATYLEQEGLQGPDDMVPDDFVRWVFPQLLSYRKPKYQALADAHGYTLDAKDAARVASEEDFMQLIEAVLERAP